MAINWPFYTGLATRVFDGIEVLFGRLPGRLCYLTVAGGALFATLTGSSTANTAMLGSLMVPEMRRRSYSSHMAMGPVLGGGNLAMIIPPSALGVLLAAIAGIDDGQLLIAGFIPGFLLAGLYALMIWFQLVIDPSGAPEGDQSHYRAHTIWRRGTVIGVTFTAMPPGTAPTYGLRRGHGAYQV